MLPNHHTRLVVLSLAAFLLLTVVQTWPLAAAPSHWSRIDNGDTALNIWAVSWVGSHLLRDPAGLFDANIFFPERLTLAYSEVMLVQGVFALPVMELGGSPVLAYNLALFAGFALTGWAFCLLVQRWTGSWTAGYVAGSLAAFNAHTLVRLGHLQTLHPEFFPLMLLALDRLIVSRRFRDVWWLAVGFVLQSLASIYFLVFAVWLLLFATASRVREWWQNAATLAIRLAASAVVALVLLWPCLSVYQQLRVESGLARAADEQIAGSWWDYLATGARVHRWWVPADAVPSVAYGFPGVMAMALVVAASTHRDTRRDPRFRMCAAAAAGCLLVSMVPRLPFYHVLHEAIPLFQAVRVPARLSQVVLLMIAVLAGFGVMAVQRRWPVTRGWWMAAALVLLVNVEALRAPISYTRFEGVPAIYEALARERAAVVAELPFPIPQQWFINAAYMVNSAKHWRPMLNGYSGFRPPSYEKSYEAARGFPSDESLILLHERGVTHVVVHQRAFVEGFGTARFDAMSSMHALQLVAREGDIVIYRLLGQ